MVTDGYQAASDVSVSIVIQFETIALAQSIRASSRVPTRGIESAFQWAIPQSRTSRGVADVSSLRTGWPRARNARSKRGVA